MVKFKSILFIIGILLGILSAAMVIPAFVDLHAGNKDWEVFATSSILSGFVSIMLIFVNREKNVVLNLREAFLLTPLSWIVLAFFAALPFYFADINLDFTRAFFESLSAITTTGATVITNLDTSPPGILIWRSILQYLGGIGIIAAATAILPMLGIGGMQLFKTESGNSNSQKFLPRATQVAANILMIYVTLSIACALLYSWCGMSGFDAINHAMTTVSTAGFSTRDASIAYFDNPKIEIVAMIFMLSGALPFVGYYKMVSGNFKSFARDSQIRFYLKFIIAIILVLSIWLSYTQEMSVIDALRYSSFNLISVITTTGYVTADYSNWGNFPMVIFFLVMFVGGCTGSSSGGLKIFRLQIALEVTASQMKQLVSPHGVFRPHFNRKSVPDTVITSVLSFFLLYALTFSISSVLLSLTGLDFLTSLSTAITTLGNVGPGLGDVTGPAKNFAALSDPALWISCLNMMLGRLEIFILIVIFSPNFWKN